MTLPLVRLSRSVVGAEEQDALTEVLREGYLGMGRHTQLFESELSQYLGGRQVVCVNTGTAALQLAVQAIGIRPGDQIIVPSLTFVASFQAIRAAGGTPVACDVDLETGFMDPEDAAGRITSRTRAIMPVHYASAAPRLAAVYELADRKGMRVIEDAAHAFGGRCGTSLVGTKGDVVCFSFDGIKNITCGEGGAVVTSDAAVAERVRDARLLGVLKDTEKRYSGERSWEFDVLDQGWRYHMSNLMAAIGRTQLRKLPMFAERRRVLAERYRSALRGAEGLRLLDLPYEQIVPHIFVVRVIEERRERLMAHLRARNIECGFHYKPNHLLTLFRTPYALPATEQLASELMSLPLHPALDDDEQTRVIEAVCGFLKGHAGA